MTSRKIELDVSKLLGWQVVEDVDVVVTNTQVDVRKSGATRIGLEKTGATKIGATKPGEIKN